jgi:hypothetical protein
VGAHWYSMGKGSKQTNAPCALSKKQHECVEVSQSSQAAASETDVRKYAKELPSGGLGPPGLVGNGTGEAATHDFHRG